MTRPLSDYEKFVNTEALLGCQRPLDALYARIIRVMQGAGFRFHHDDPETFLASVRRCFGRAAFERRDLRTMHVIVAIF